MYCTRVASLFTLGIAFQVAGCATTASRDSANTKNWTAFGQKISAGKGPAVSAEEVLTNLARYDGKTLRVSGKVSAVCARKGCWIRLAGPSSGETLFVKFTCPVGGRLVPMSAVGREALVQGTLQVTEISQADARHYKEDAGASPAEIAKIVGPQRIITMKAPAATIDLTGTKKVSG